MPGRSMKYEIFFFFHLKPCWVLLFPSKVRESSSFGENSSASCNASQITWRFCCYSSLLPANFFLESCFAEWLFLAAQLNFPGSPQRRLFLGCWYYLFQQVSSALSNPEQLLLCMPACLVNRLSLCFLESCDLLLLASHWKITERKMFFLR